MPSKPKWTPKQALNEAFETATRALAADMPLLVHGSGGGEGNFETQRLVAALTAQYCRRLVEAALDARDNMLVHSSGSDILLPPPPFQRSRKPALPSDISRKRAAEEFWDDPLPAPKIRGQQSGAHDEELDDDHWVGLAGVDLYEHSRARAAYVRGISSQQFIFPVCHDTYVYGRIREVQAAKLTVTDPLLHDVALLDMVRTEGGLQHHEALLRRRQLRTTKTKTKKNGDKSDNITTENTSDPEDDEDAEEADAVDDEEGPAWPGLASLLPGNRGIV